MVRTDAGLSKLSPLLFAVVMDASPVRQKRSTFPSCCMPMTSYGTNNRATC